MESRKEKAVRLFQEGYNCSQAVFAAFSDKYGLDEHTALKIASSFGGGMGRMREVCGAVSGMFLAAGLETGTCDGKDIVGKKKNYEMVQLLAQEFKKEAGSIICRELLRLDKNINITITSPSERTKEYYKKRPCVQLVGLAAETAEQILFNENKEGTKE